MLLGKGDTSRVGGPTSPGAVAQGKESPTRAVAGARLVFRLLLALVGWAKPSK